ncbi:MAG TPA: AAA family ATPase [Dehalococcoidia bacterium]|nr:AAA family ATPase [Dehalococcoidia bacterium]
MNKELVELVPAPPLRTPPGTPVPLTTILADDGLKIKWLWGSADGGLIPEEDITLLCSYSGEGKTLLSFHLAAALSVGGACLNLPAAGPFTTLIMTETSKRQVRKIFSQVEEVDPERIFIIFSNSGVTELGLRIALERLRPEVLIIDSLTSAVPILGVHGTGPIDWFAPTHATAVGGWLRRLQETFHLRSVLALAHLNKVRVEPGESRRRPTLHDVRGSGAVVEQVDGVIHLTPSLSGEPGMLTVLKDRTDEAIQQWGFVYDSLSGRLVAGNQVPITDEAILTLVRQGVVSTTDMAHRFRRRKQVVQQWIAGMVERGLLHREGKVLTCV